MTEDMIARVAASADQVLLTGTICEVAGEEAGTDGRVLVAFSEAERISCRCLAGDELCSLREGDCVIVLRAIPAGDSIVIGRIRGTDEFEAARAPRTADEIVIEAGKSLTLKVGDGSITIREDGRILIKGKDLVSHAKRNNRIRGGSVQIN